MFWGDLPPDIIWHTVKHTTQNLPLISTKKNEADATDKTFLDTPAMNVGETSAHIYVGYNLKITDIYKSKSNSVAEFLDALQDWVCTRRVPTKLIVDNVPMYRGWNITKYLQDLIFPMWQYATKHQNQNPV